MRLPAAAMRAGVRCFRTLNGLSLIVVDLNCWRLSFFIASGPHAGSGNSNTTSPDAFCFKVLRDAARRRSPVCAIPDARSLHPQVAANLHGSMTSSAWVSADQVVQQRRPGGFHPRAACCTQAPLSTRRADDILADIASEQLCAAPGTHGSGHPGKIGLGDQHLGAAIQPRLSRRQIPPPLLLPQAGHREPHRADRGAPADRLGALGACPADASPAGRRYY